MLLPADGVVDATAVLFVVMPALVVVVVVVVVVVTAADVVDDEEVVVFFSAMLFPLPDSPSSMSPDPPSSNPLPETTLHSTAQHRRSRILQKGFETIILC